MATTTFSPLARELHTRLTAPRPDHEAFQGPLEDVPDIARLSRDELGALWAVVDRAHYNGRAYEEAAVKPPATWDNRPAYQLAVAILQEAQELRHWPRMTDDQVLDYLARSEGNQRAWQRALEALAWRADQQAPLPPGIAQELRRILGEIGDHMPGAGYDGGPRVVGRCQSDALVIAHSLQPDGRAPEVDAIAEVYRRTCPEGRYARLELDRLLAQPPDQVRRGNWPNVSLDPAVIAGHRAFDEHVLRDAAEYLEAIHRGNEPYVPYKAFGSADLEIIRIGFVRALRRDDPWASDVGHKLLILAASPPDGKSKAMPSQTLACSLAEQISLRPTPAGIASLQEAGTRTLNGTVQRTLGQRLQQARSALALRPDVVLALAATEPPSPKQQTRLATLLQSTYCTGLDFSLADWQAQLLAPVGANSFTQALVWRAEPADGGLPFAFMATLEAGTAAATDAQGAPVNVPATARIRLWHPLHGTPEERRAWQAHLRQRQVRQPLRQAFREYYEPLADELKRPAHADVMWEANRSERFAGLQLTVKPLIGLARAEGWKIDPDAGLVRQFGTVEVHFELGDEIFPGMAGAIESVAYSFWKRGTRPRRVPMADMPPIVYSEASRAVDLLVSTCAHAYVGEDSREPMTVGEAGIQLMNEPAPPRSGPLHPRLRREIRLRQLATVPLGDMRAMRRQVLEDTFSEQVRAGHVAFDDRSASIGALTVNLNTAKVSRGGEQIDFKLPKVGSKGSKLAALPWVPYDEALLEKLVGTIATLLAA